MEDVEPGVVFRAINCGEKPVMIVGLQLRVKTNKIDITASTQGDKNRKVIKESEIFERTAVSRSELVRKIRTETGRKPPFKCKAVIHTSTGRRPYCSKRFTI